MQIYPGTDGRRMETESGEEPSTSGTTAGKKVSSIQMTKALYVDKYTIDFNIKTTIIGTGCRVLNYHLSQ